MHKKPAPVPFPQLPNRYPLAIEHTPHILATERRGSAMAPISLNTQQEPRKSFPPHEDLLLTFQNYAASASTAKALMEHITQNLHEKMTRYNWVGFYLVDPTDSGMLLVGPYVGSFTPNARIPLNTGLCGAAASTGRTVVVHDVSKDPRYLCGSPMVKCEIVVPIFVKKQLAAALDVESYFSGTFTKAEEIFVENCAALVGKYLART
jgi:L-methionine (R)-S-oxide reductase